MIVVGEVARVLLEVLAVIHGAVLVAIFESAVELVGPAFEGEADRAAGGVSQFRGRARTPKLHLFKCVDGRLDKSAGLVRREGGADGLFPADPVHHIAHLRLRLADDVIAGDRQHAFHVVEDALRLELLECHLIELLGHEQRSADGVFRIEERRRRGYI